MSYPIRALFISAILIIVALIAVGCDNEVSDLTDRPTPASAGNDPPEPTRKAATTPPTPIPTPAAAPASTPTTDAITEPVPPVAGERPHSFTQHGITIEDPWHWLRDADYPTVDDADVLAYLSRRK